MARLRTLKPGFFTNELLAEVEPLGRLLFQGLWCLADRAGRLEDRPRKIKAEVLPYDECDVDATLDRLAERGFITRYVAGGVPYIQVTNFTKHQTPHIREAASTIPEPAAAQTSTVLAPDQHSASTTGNLDPVVGTGEWEPDRAPAREAPAAPAVVVADQPAADQPYALFEALCEVMEADPAGLAPSLKRKQLGIAKRLLEQGYGEAKVRACLTFLRSQAWRTSTIDLATVEAEIGKWELNGMPRTAATRASPPVNGRPDGREPIEAGAVAWMKRHGIQAPAPS